jgi:hypothetical protein
MGGLVFALLLLLVCAGIRLECAAVLAQVLVVSVRR